MDLPKEADAQFIRERLASGCFNLHQLLVDLNKAQGKVAANVHAIRKLGKSVRGGFSLFSLKKSPALNIQAIGRLLSGRRDAVSRLNTWNRLGWNDDPRVAAAIHGLLDQQTHSASHRPPPPAIAWCLDHITAAQQELQAMPAEHLADQIAHGLKTLEHKTFKRCRKLGHRADKDFHQARKSLKAWLGAIGFLPEGMVPHDPQLNELAELLGDENDLATLSVWLKRHGFTPQLAPGLWATLDASRRKLQRDAIRMTKGLAPSLT
ncbi:MAG: CHAD domain-containing protein [Verrucomicrobiota bacterium]